MSRRLTTTLLYAALCLIGTSGVARAEAIGRYECGVDGEISLEPVGDREGHRLMSFRYSCIGVDGLLKGATYTATAITEWDGPRGKFLFGGGIHRAAAGFAVTQVTEAAGSVVMKDGKPVGTETSGKAMFKFASGTFAALSAKAFNFATVPTGVGRFNLDLTD